LEGFAEWAVGILDARGALVSVSEELSAEEASRSGARDRLGGVVMNEVPLRYSKVRGSGAGGAFRGPAVRVREAGS
jgi:hypothetical protein